MVEGARTIRDPKIAEIEVTSLLSGLLTKMSLKDAAQLAADLTGQKKNALYEQALDLQNSHGKHRE